MRSQLSIAMRRYSLEPAAARVVLAAMACERAEGGYATRAALVAVADVGDRALPARLSKGRWLEVVDITPEGWVVYRATDRAWTELGFERAPQAAE